MATESDVHDAHSEPESEDKPGWQRLTDESVQRLQEVADSRVGQTLAGRFELGRVLAIGGMATVYEAIQSPLMRRVAVKILHHTEIEAGRTVYFLREANAAAALRHPNIISIVDFGQEDDGTLFLAMEYVPGLTLSELLAREYPLPHNRLIRIIEQVCLALEVAHRAGVIHCDMKPGNIMIESVPGNPDHVKVLDFGISRRFAPGQERSFDAGDEIIGSYYYMAPEQIQGRAVSPQTDVYGLGVVLYTALTAAFPFAEQDDETLMEAILQKDPLPPSMIRPELPIPPALDAVVRRAMSKVADDRFVSCAEFRKALLSLETQTLHPMDDIDTPHSLEILLPEDELFDIDVDIDRDDDDDDMLDHDPFSELDGTFTTNPSLPELMRPTAPDAHPAILPPDNAMSALSGRPPVIGRGQQLAELQRAALMTRRGVVSTHVTGPFGCGASHFVRRTLELLNVEMGATVLVATLNPDAREYPLRALGDLLVGALDEFRPMNPGDSAFARSQERREGRRNALNAIPLADIERQALHSIFDRWIATPSEEELALLDPDERPYDNSPLRFPETRTAILAQAFAELFRRLVDHGRQSQQGEPPHRAPLVLTIDGWEYCDQSTQQVLRRVLTDHHQLPVLFIAVTHQNTDVEGQPFPETLEALSTAHSLAGQPWDMIIPVPPYTLQEVRAYLIQQLGQDPGESLVYKFAASSGGNPLFIKELLHQANNTLQEGEEDPELLPESPARLFAQQIDGLSRDGKMLLAVCTLLGQTFPVAAVRVIMPGEFDVDGTFAELMGARVLEPVNDDIKRLRFRFPRMRGTSLRRLHPRLRQGLHARIVKLLLAQNLPIKRNEAESWLAVHRLKAGEPLLALDALLDAGEAAMTRWEPELAMRRARQVQLWIACCLTQHHRAAGVERALPIGAPEVTPGTNPLMIDAELATRTPGAALEERQLRATRLLLSAARRLQIKPERRSKAIIAERLPQRLFDQLRHQGHLPMWLRAGLAFELGRYFSRLELYQSARAALQFALQLARQAGGDFIFELRIEMDMVRTLQSLGRTGPAADLAARIMERVRPLGEDDNHPELSLSKPLDLMARIYIGRRLYPRAEHFLDQARAYAEADGDRDQLCKIFLHYSALYRAQNQPARTLQALNLADQAAEACHDLRAKARVLYNLGIASANLGRRAQGRRYLANAIEIALCLGWTDFIALVNGQLKKL